MRADTFERGYYVYTVNMNKKQIQQRGKEVTNKIFISSPKR